MIGASSRCLQRRVGPQDRIAFPMQLRLAIAMFAAIAAAGALAAPPKAPPNAREHLTLESAVQQVQQQTDGRILAADSIPSGRNKLYRIKVLTPEGHVRVMQLHSNDPPAKNNKRDSSGGH